MPAFKLSPGRTERQQSGRFAAVARPCPELGRERPVCLWEAGLRDRTFPRRLL